VVHGLEITRIEKQDQQQMWFGEYQTSTEGNPTKNIPNWHQNTHLEYAGLSWVG